MPEATIAELAAALRDGATVVDVREPREYVEGHVPGAVLVPMAQVPARADDLDRSRPVYVVCASGNRSSAMADVLVRRGIDARSVVGGTQSWTAAGHPVVTGPRPA